MPTIGAENKNYGNSDKWLENADYFRCENISVAYTFPRSLKRGRWGVGAENCHNCHNCHAFVVEMGSVDDDGFLASCCFREEKA